MKTLEKGQEKIQKICDKLRRETIEPAKEEAHHIIEAAKQRADEIIKEAENHTEQLLKLARTQIEQERNVFQSSLHQAGKQAVEALRQDIENKIFSKDLQVILDKNMGDPKLIADLINALVKTLEKGGAAADFSAVIPKVVSREQVIALLLDEVKKQLKDKPLELGSFGGGVQLKLVGKRMTIDITDQAIKELLSNYARKDFRQIIFAHKEQ